jgi:hypothetical protein
MSKVTNIIEALKAKNCQVIEEEDHLGYRMIGIRKPNQWVYHWFIVFQDTMLFRHSYSQNTGRTKKGTRHGWKVQQSLEKLISITFIID